MIRWRDQSNRWLFYTSPAEALFGALVVALAFALLFGVVGCVVWLQEDRRSDRAACEQHHSVAHCERVYPR